MSCPKSSDTKSSVILSAVWRVFAPNGVEGPAVGTFDSWNEVLRRHTNNPLNLRAFTWKGGRALSSFLFLWSISSAGTKFWVPMSALHSPRRSFAAKVGERGIRPTATGELLVDQFEGHVFHRLRKNSTRRGFCNRARLQSCRKTRHKRRALAPAGLSVADSPAIRPFSAACSAPEVWFFP